MLNGKFVSSSCFAAILSMLAGPGLAGGNSGGSGNCATLPNNGALRAALQKAVGAGGNGGLGFDMWGTIVDKSGIVCAVAFSGSDFTQQWLGSRVISAQKANTGNSFSLSTNARGGGLALSSANLFSAVQPGGSLYGLQQSNPVETDVAYGNQPASGQFDPPPANAANFGTPQDPMVGKRIGGINVFGGGLALYVGGVRMGGLGVSGDTSCTDHMVSWRTRNSLHLDGFATVGGVSGDAAHPDNIIFDITPNPAGGTGVSKSGFGHATCLHNPDPSILPAVQTR
jgi:Haem-degrading